MGKNFKFVLITIFFTFITHYLMAFIHLQVHNILAWSFGFFKNPFNLDYIALSIFLVDKLSDFDMMFKTGHKIFASIVAITPSIVNIILFFISLYFASSKKIHEKKYLYYFFYWFMIMNLGQIYSNVYRSFELPGDFQVFAKGLNISSYWIFIPGILFVIYGCFVVLAYKIPQAYKIMNISQMWKQALFLFNTLLILFGYFGGLVYEIMHKTYFYLIYPILFIILFFLICFPKNRWVQNRILNIKH